MKCYLAGWQASTTARETRLIDAGVITHRCLSFANIVKIPGFPFYTTGMVQGYEVCVERKIGIMMDSGVFSYRRYRRKLITTNDKKNLALLPDEAGFTQIYIDFCKKYAKHWDFYVTMDLDFDGNANFKRHVALEKAGLRATPVFHGDEDCSMDMLRRYRDRGYSHICFGTGPRMRTTVKQQRQYLDAVFNEITRLGMTCHGLAVTAPWMMLEYPWYSVDSSSWSRAAGYGSILRFDKHSGRMTQLHISNKGNTGIAKHMPLDTMAWSKHLKKQLEEEGFDYKELQNDHTARHLYNAMTMQKLAKFGGSRQRAGAWRHLF
jgi:hypothetical protein